MRLEKVQAYLKERQMPYDYAEEDGCGSIDLNYRGVPYHIWEFQENGWGVETNLRDGGHSEDLLGDYEAAVLELLKNRK